MSVDTKEDEPVVAGLSMEVEADSEGRTMLMDENGKPVVYKRRFFVLLSLSLSYLAWNLSTSRMVAVVPSYALHFDVPNQAFSSDGLGVDSMTVIEGILLVATYLFGSYSIDRWGLKMMIVGSFSIAASTWGWYLSGDNFAGVIVSRTFATALGTSVPAALMAVSNRWFPEGERATATATGALMSLVGAGAALILAPLYGTEPDQVVDLTLKSCLVEDLDIEVVVAFQESVINGTFLPCVDPIRDQSLTAFCCYLPVDIEGLDFTIAIVATFAFFVTLVSVRDLPPTPPSYGAEEKDFVSIWEGTKLLFGKDAFRKLALSDFIVSAPPLALFAALARIFPPSVADYSFIASAAGLGLAIPSSVLVGYLLGKYKAYYTFTLAGYATGAALFVLGTICFLAGTDAGDWIFFGAIVLAIASFVVWQVSVYEAKLEYCFGPQSNLEGILVGTDRIIINLSGLVGTSLLVPEVLGAAKYTYISGSIIMVIGLIPVLLINDKYTYYRLMHENEKKAADGVLKA